MQTKKLVRVSSKGQIVLPKKYREQMGIGEGDYIQVEQLSDDTLLVEKQEVSSIEPILQRFRAAAKARNFTRNDLEEAIREVRRKRKAS